MEIVYYFAFFFFFLKMPSFWTNCGLGLEEIPGLGQSEKFLMHFELRTSRTSLRAPLEWKMGDENCGAPSCSVEKVSPGDERWKPRWREGQRHRTESMSEPSFLEPIHFSFCLNSFDLGFCHLQPRQF